MMSRKGPNPLDAAKGTAPPHLVDTPLWPDIPGMKFKPLYSAITQNVRIDLRQCDLGKDLEVALHVANVVRHGDGRSSNALRVRAAGDAKQHAWMLRKDKDLANQPNSTRKLSVPGKPSPITPLRGYNPSSNLV